MNKTVLVRLAGLILGPILVMAIAAYIAYPYINEGRYNEVVDKYDREKLIVKPDGTKIGRDFETVVEQVEYYQKQNAHLQNVIDSLESANEGLNEELEKSMSKIEDLRRARSGLTFAGGPNRSSQQSEEFSERIKSLLGLDEESLTPIVNQMSDEQIFQLYQGGGTIQRRKLLRSLKPERAAKLMSEVIL